MGQPFDSEVDDAKQLVKKLHGVPEGFTFEEQRHAPKSAGIEQITYTVKVSMRSKSSEYEGGHGKDWLTPFEADLRAGWHGVWMLQPN